MYPHPIRLRGPWEVEPLAGTALSAPVRVTMPCTWASVGLGDLVGRVRLRRRFGYPGRIDPHERVWLLLPEGAPAAVLNGRPLGGSSEYDVTDLLGPRNELTIDLEVGPGRPDGWEGAALEVRAAAYLRGVEVTHDGRSVTVRGRVAGQVDAPLELYLVADRRPSAYAVVPPGGDFVFELAAPDAREIRLDLVCGASVWYRFETEAPAAAAPRV